MEGHRQQVTGARTGPMVRRLTPDEEPRRGHLLVSVSNALSRAHARAYGHGPEEARAYLVDNLLVVVLRGVLTRAERTLLSRGLETEVRSLRAAFHEAMRAEFMEEVTRLTGRRVAVFTSHNSLEPDVAVQVFILEDEAAGAPRATPS